MRVLFLDIDGVLNNKWSIKAQGTNQVFDRKCLEHLHRIVIETGALLVVSSNWREGNALWVIQLALVQRGIWGPIIDMTPVLKDSPEVNGLGLFEVRGVEIRRWLTDHPWVQGYAVVDDNPVTGHDGHLFMTDHHIGLDEKVATAIIDHLSSV